MVMVKYELVCEKCGISFKAKRADYQIAPKYCSNKCKFSGQIGKTRKKIINVDFRCEVCGKHVVEYRGPKRLAEKEPRFCSNKCVGFSQRGENNPNYKNGKRVLKGGYIGIVSPGHPHVDSYGVVTEHRLVMEKIVGRFLTKEEVVHHKDKVRSNNKPDNLVLFENQAEHLKMHMGENKK